MLGAFAWRGNLLGEAALYVWAEVGIAAQLAGRLVELMKARYCTTSFSMISTSHTLQLLRLVKCLDASAFQSGKGLQQVLIVLVHGALVTVVASLIFQHI